ncbi:MAG TPA: dihydrofolate reductase family protein [Bauldia sp.]|nr:dihydrofolate reductase family protein [Bauldia sp.]
MRKVSVFNNVSIDGYYTDADNDYGFAHEGADDPELQKFTAANAKGENALVFGRLTYELMAAWWPSKDAARAMPEVAKGMNAAPKYVFSLTLSKADWANTTLLKSDPAKEIARLKKTAGPDLTILGSGSIVAQLAKAGLVDEVQLMVCPVVLGAGKSQFAGARARWTLARSRTFGNGRVFLAYELAA